jgi:hypothetical protein
MKVTSKPSQHLISVRDLIPQWTPLITKILILKRGQYKSGVKNQKFNRNGGSKFKKIETVFQIEN